MSRSIPHLPGREMRLKEDRVAWLGSSRPGILTGKSLIRPSEYSENNFGRLFRAEGNDCSSGLNFLVRVGCMFQGVQFALRRGFITDHLDS